MATTYQSFGGTDIHAVFDNKIFGELQMVSYNISREKAPVYTMGNADLRTIARGKRSVTGGCVFVVFDEDTLLEGIKESTKQPFLDANDTANYSESAANAGGSVDLLAGETVTLTDTTASVGGNSLTSAAPPRLADQILPFDITLVAANEYGSISKMVIKGVELMSEKGGVSIDDLVLEKQMAFIARSVTPWKNVVSGVDRT